MSEAALREAIANELGSPVSSISGVGGGDIHDARAVTLADGRRLFVKSGRNAAPGMFAAEARGLAWLEEAGALRVPKVLLARDEAPAFLALELLEPGAPIPDYDELLGRGLAQLHGYGAPGFGLDHANYIGSLPQDNRPCPNWPEFYRTRRLEPQLELARSTGRAGREMLVGFDRLFARLPELLGPTEAPARLHGDLWAGNVHRDADGRPVLIDPAVYGGHREIDLAMMKLFGGFSARCFAAYREAAPLASDWEQRVPIYQLYPLMVHVNLFGGGYASSVERVLARHA